MARGEISASCAKNKKNNKKNNWILDWIELIFPEQRRLKVFKNILIRNP